MPFDDNDLKRLKGDMKTYREHSRLLDVRKDQIVALLARLEAAENICLFQQTHYFGKAPELENLYRQWFKSRGDGGRKHVSTT
jgi:hypothetical protein